MASIAQKIPSPSIPVVNTNGRLSPVWYEFFRDFGTSAVDQAELTLSTVSQNVLTAAILLTDFTGETLLRTKGYTAVNDGGAATWYLTGNTGVAGTTNFAAGLLYDGGGNEFKISETEIFANMLGVKGDGNTDDSSALSNALTYVATLIGSSEGAELHLAHGKQYLLDTGVVVPGWTTLQCHGSLIIYSGTGVAVTLGVSDSGLTHFPRIMDFFMHLQDKDSTGVRLRGARSAEVKGYIQGLYAPFDNTRTNVGVDVDGVDVSSFFNLIQVSCNHVHKSFYIHTSGTVNPTDTVFLNCTAFGDRTTDTTSIAYHFTGTASGQGSAIIGGNIERVNKGIYFDGNSGQVTASGVRFEVGTNTADLEFNGSGTSGCSIVGCQGLSNIVDSHPAVNKNIVTDSSGRLGSGNLGQLVNKALTLDYNGNAAFNIFTEETSTGVGKIRMQAGAGSTLYGGSLHLYANAHASLPGDVAVGLSGGAFRVNTSGIDAGTDLLKVDGDTTAANTRLLIYDNDNATLERVSVGAADSGGAGFKVLRIAN